jgi:hypothetical protein
MAEARKPIAYLEAVVRIPLYEGDKFSERGPGDWWRYEEPQATSAGVATCIRPVTEVSRRMLDGDGNINYSSAKADLETFKQQTGVR